MNMLELAARALVDNYPLDSGETPLDWEEVLPVVRAVLGAIREPNEAVLKTMRNTVPVDGYEWEYRDDEAVAHWQAMIDAVMAKEGK